MINRKVKLAFNEKKQLEQYVLRFCRDHLFYRFYFRYIFDF